MKAISATFEAHQQGSARVPSVRVIARPERWGVPLLRWERYDSGSENDSPHAMTVADDGSLIRARNDWGTLNVSRVTSPGSGSTYSSWTNLATITSGKGVALASRVGEVILVYINNGGLDLCIRTSADDGATWSGETVLRSEGNPFQYPSIALKADGDARIFTAKNGTVVRITKRDSGIWTHGGNWTQGASISSSTGIAALHDGIDYHVIVSGYAPTTLDPMVLSFLFGDSGFPSGVWSSAAQIAEADAASTTDFAGPFITQPAGVDYRVFWTARESGAVAVDRVYSSHPPALAGGNPANWFEPEPHEVETASGLAVHASGSADIWGTTAASVWYAETADSVELSARVIGASYWLTPLSTRARVVLDNAAGALNDLPNVDFPGVVPGGTIEIAPGYESGTAGAGEYGVSVNVVVDRISYEADASRSRVVLECSGHWERIAAWRAPQAWQSAAGALSREALFWRVCAKAGIRVSGTGGTNWSTLTPAFMVAPGESGLTAARRLLEVADEAVISDGDRLAVSVLDSTSDYEYGPDDHPIASLSFSDGPLAANWVRA